MMGVWLRVRVTLRLNEREWLIGNAGFDRIEV